MSFDLSTLSTSQLYDHLQQVYERARAACNRQNDPETAFPTADGQVVLICGRGLKDGKPVPNVHRQWNDTLYVVWKDAAGKHVEPFVINTEHSAEGGESVLCPGLWKYALGHHHRDDGYEEKSIDTPGYEHGDYRYRALNSVEAVDTIWDQDQDLQRDSNESIEPLWSINIHYGGSDSTPGGWSEGCQTVYQWDRYKKLIELCEADLSIERGEGDDDFGTGTAGSGSRPVIYALILGEEFAPGGAYGLSFPVDLGAGTGVTPEAIEAYHRHTEKEILGGYYPIGANTIWHGGVHVHGPEGAPVLACAAGTLVAARLEPASHAEQLEYGSRNFVLLRHGTGDETFYSLYAHLGPLPDDDARLAELPWLAGTLELAPGAKEDGVQRDATGRYIIAGSDSSANVSENFKVYEVLNGTSRVRVDLVTELQAVRTALECSVTVVSVDPAGHACVVTSSGSLLEAAAARKQEAGVLVAVESQSGGVRLAVAADPTHDEALVAALRAGDLVTPGKSVAGGSALGVIGRYGAPGHEAPLVHWEVFSAKNLLAGVEGWTEVVDPNEDFTIDPAQVFGMVDQQWSINDPDSDNIQDFELQAFYAGDGAAALRTQVCKFVSEWGVPDLDAAISAMIDVWFEDGLKEAIEPYQWWSQLVAAGQGDLLPASRHVYHYNPAALLAHLAEGGAAPAPAPEEPAQPGAPAEGGAPGSVALTGSVGQDGDNHPQDVEAVKRRFVELGYDWLTVNTECDPDLIQVIKLFQSIKNSSCAVGGDGRIDVDGDTHRWLNAGNAPRWMKIDAECEGLKNHEWNGPGQTGLMGYGTDWLDAAIRGAAAHYQTNYRASHPGAAMLQVNDCALVHGGPNTEHSSHQTGLDVDIRLPRTDGECGGIVVDDESGLYDRDAMRAILDGFLAQSAYVHSANDLWLIDDTLIEEGKCHYLAGHDDHLHVRLRAPARVDGAAPAQGTTPEAAPADTAQEQALDGGFYYTVVSGDSLSLIAMRNGVPSWEDIYHHALNADFRALRPDPDLIHPGDRVFVPSGQVANA